MKESTRKKFRILQTMLIKLQCDDSIEKNQVIKLELQIINILNGKITLTKNQLKFWNKVYKYLKKLDK